MATVRSTCLPLGAVTFTLLLCGCASTWDDLTSRERKWGELFVRRDPLTTLRESDDGERRAEALRQLTEPQQRRGSQEQQELYLQILVDAARKDRDPLCRVSAIRTLGGYKDPRAVGVLEEIYQQKLPFTQDFNALVRHEALTALEKTGAEEARHILVRAAKQPGPSAIESSLTDRQQTLDEKLIAIRALGQYKHQECIDALVDILKTEKDVALTDRARTSLEQATGRKASEFLSPPAPQNVRATPNPAAIQPVMAYPRPQ